jgi:hypothetical protein
MMNLRFSLHESKFVVLLTSLALSLSFLANPAFAADDEDDEDAAGSMSILPATPDWVDKLETSARYVNVSGSESKFREDHNIQSGVDLEASVSDDSGDGKIFSVDGLYQPVEGQGYGRFGYDRLGIFSFDAEVQGWTEYYNARPGVKDTTVLGSRINNTGIYPFTTNSRALYGGGKPKVDWLTLRTGIGVELPGPFNDVYGDILYRDVSGEMSLAKGGTVFDPVAVPPVIPGSGPGTVAFDFPGRKDVDYETIGGLAGTRASLGGIAWRFDASAYRHEIQSSTREANFATNALDPNNEIDAFREDSDIFTANANLVASRQVTRDLFLYGGGVFSWTENEPEPSQIVQTGFAPAPSAEFFTRLTNDSEVTRSSGAFNTGLVYQPINSVVMTGDLGVRASHQEGDLTELRNESTLPTGDTGIVVNDSERDHLSFLARGEVKWNAARRLTFKGHGSYRYTSDDLKSSRFFAFVVGEPAEIEDYTIDRERIKVGASGRYRFRGGRKLEIGYAFMYDGSDTDIDSLNNQFVVADYERFQHKVFMKGSARITKKLRGELRGQYTFEERDMDSPWVQPRVIPGASGEVEFQGWTIAPTLTYQHSATLSGYFALTVGQQEWEIVNGGVDPAGFSSRFASFEYDTITETASLGVNWAPVDRIKSSLTYTVYNNTESVENMGHDAAIRGAYELDENWDITSGLRYLSYAPDNNTLDDYDAFILSLGLSGTF